jgi:DNA-binding transcriptional MerR regulator
MFSRASALSVKTLRAYHEGGILVPARVDPATGYRSYTTDQLADAAIVTRLRALDLPLEKVRRIIQARDPELTSKILAEHEIAMQERLAVTARIVAELQSGSTSVTHTPVHVRDEPAVDTVRIVEDVPIDDFGSWIADSFGRLERFLLDLDVPLAGPAGALYHPEIAEDSFETVEVFLPIARPIEIPSGRRDITLGEVPAARVAVLVHTGGYDSIGETYRALGAWVARHAVITGERVREWYVVGPDAADDPAAYRTEISWPVEPTGAASPDATASPDEEEHRSP